MAEWKCLKCGNEFDREMAEKALEEGRKLAGSPGVGRMLHICGVCRTLHCADGEGGLRLLTTAERFQVEMDSPEILRQIEAFGGEHPVMVVKVASAIGPDEVSVRHEHMILLAQADMLSAAFATALKGVKPDNWEAETLKLNGIIKGIFDAAPGSETKLTWAVMKTVLLATHRRCIEILEAGHL